ncbi:sodium:calcium antiporter [Thermodesulfobacteriota bacterium]
MISYILLAVGFVIFIKGADFLVEGAFSIGRQLNVSDLVIGLNVVAFGTLTPELFVNIFAGVKGITYIAIGNILGRNITNILLILGVSALIYPLSVTRGAVWKKFHSVSWRQSFH